MNAISEKNSMEIIVRQNNIEMLAINLADWFGKDRELPKAHTGAIVLEHKYVENILKEIDRNFQEIIALTNDWEIN